jgi:hypothetical protein
MTDRNGVERPLSVPQGMVDGDIVKEQKNIAEEILPDLFQELLFPTGEPFVQAIYDLSVSRMAFDQMCLIWYEYLWLCSIVLRIHLRQPKMQLLYPNPYKGVDEILLLR